MKKKRKYIIIKRIIDIVISLFALITLLVPMLLVSLTIVLDSKGPVLFKQKRIGKNKKTFNIYKFRSMYVDTNPNSPTNELYDAKNHITRVGRFIRKYSIDELPQLINIFIGDMSFVGPRPALWNQYDLIEERDKYFANDIKPGLTGLAQISGRDELSIVEKAKYDGDYVKKQSFWFDFVLIIKTFISVFMHKGVVEGATSNKKKDMTVCFVCNYMNHHQISFCQEMIDLTNDNFVFIACLPLRDERRLLGYEDMNDLPFVIKAYENKIQKTKAKNYIKKDDIVIFGSCPNRLIKIRAKTGKKFYFYAERFFKNGIDKRNNPITYLKLYNHYLKYKKKNPVYLCASAYLPYDLKLLHCYNKTLKWGYFPPLKKYNIDELIAKKNKMSILWTGRFIEWKHPESAIFMIKKLVDSGVNNVHLEMIGNGQMFAEINKLVDNLNLRKYVSLIGAITKENVRFHMEASSIFLCTSDSHEGWGAVINEAMNSGCAVIVSDEVGSTRYLIENNFNGIVYKSLNVVDLYNKVKELLNDEKEMIKMQKNAYNTICEKWNAKEASERLFEIFEFDCNVQNVLYSSGPCSIAEVIKPPHIKI